MLHSKESICDLAGRTQIDECNPANANEQRQRHYYVGPSTFCVSKTEPHGENYGTER